MNNSRKTVKELQNLCSGKATKINLNDWFS
jgi:hypothetical protein